MRESRMSGNEKTGIDSECNKFRKEWKLLVVTRSMMQAGYFSEMIVFFF